MRELDDNFAFTGYFTNQSMATTQIRSNLVLGWINTIYNKNMWHITVSHL